MTVKSYTKKVAKYLLCPPSMKKEIIRQMESDIAGAVEQGETLEEVLTGMGEPKDVAAEFNDNFSEKEKEAALKRKRRNKVLLVVAVVVALLALLAGIIFWMLPKTKEIEESSIFSKEEVIGQAEEIVALLDADDYEALEEQMTEQMKEIDCKESLMQAKEALGGEFGTFLRFTNEEALELTQSGQTYAVVWLYASYENVSVVYQLSFDEEMQLAGIYLR